jgi:hypothetical protein
MFAPAVEASDDRRQKKKPQNGLTSGRIAGISGVPAAAALVACMLGNTVM